MTSAPTITSLPWEARELADDLVNGKPEIGWRGDPRLSLNIGYVETKRSGFNKRLGRYVQVGEIIDWRYEVYRHNEDGTDSLLATWPQKDFQIILTDLVKMDVRTRGRVNAEDETGRAREAFDNDASRRIQEAHGEMAEHALKLWRDRNLGKPTIYLNTPEKKHDGGGYVVRDRRASASMGE